MLSILSKKARQQLQEENVTTYQLLNNDFIEKSDILTARDKEKLKTIREAFDSYQVEQIERLTVKSSSYIGKHLVNMLQPKKQEEVYVLSLNTKNEVISMDMIFRGSLNSSVAHPREIFKKALEHSAARIILAHNHPSGNTDPSEADLSFTRRAVDAGEMLGIEVLDHFIIGNDYLSLRETGLM